MAGSRLRGAGPGALALAILAAFLFLPVVGAFLVFIFPAPLAYARLKHGTAHFALLSAACLAMTTLAGGFPSVTVIVAGLCVMAYTLGGSVAEGESTDRAVVKGTLSSAIFVGLAAGLFFLAIGVNPWVHLDKTLEEGIAESVQLYRRMGMSQADIDQLMPSLRLLKYIISGYLPAVAICVSTLVSFTSCYLLRRHASRTGLSKGVDEPLGRWCAPDHAVWGVVVPGFMMIPGSELLRQAAGNLLAVFALVYLFQGLAVVAYLFDRIRLSPLLRALATLVALLQPIILLVVWCVGLFDTWADFRKVRRGRTGA